MARSAAGKYRAIQIVHRSDLASNAGFETRLEHIRQYAPVSQEHAHLLPVELTGVTSKGELLYNVMPLADDVARLPAWNSAGTDLWHATSPAPRPALFVPDSYAPATLQRMLHLHGPLSRVECVSLGLCVTGALNLLHDRGWVHGGIAPSNILFLNGLPVLAPPSFSPADPVTYPLGDRAKYAPPEGPGTPQADLYSLGRVLREALGAPFEDTGSEPDRLRDAPSPREPLESGLALVLLLACETDPSRRYGTADAMRGALAALVKAI
jgi:hypothetical protein